MLKVNQNLPLPTTEYILDKISDYQIFKFYFSEYEPGEGAINSPLRKDKNASFSIYYNLKYNKLMYHDFREKSGGDCFIFVSKLLSLNYFETLCRICADFNLKEVFTGNFKIKQRNKYKNIKPNYDKLISETLIQIKSKEFTDKELKWWSNFNINKELLNYYNIFSCEKLFINNTIINSFKPMYAFIEYKDKYSYKIYSPFDEKYKWITNHTSDVIQGWNQLPETGNLLFITKSLKDVCSLRSIGYYSIAPQSESSFLKLHVLDQLRKRFERIIIYYDNDLAGLEMSAKFSKETGLERFYNPIGHPKDPSDFIKFYGKNNLKLILNKYK